MNMYCLYDSFSNFYEPPHSFASDDEAARTLARYFVLTGHRAKHFDLYCIAVFDPNTAEILPMSPYKVDNFKFYLKKGFEDEDASEE